MKGIKIEDDKIIIEISFCELTVIINSLNEVFRHIESWEFESRLGIDVEEAKKVFDHLMSIYVSGSS